MGEICPKLYNGQRETQIDETQKKQTKESPGPNLRKQSQAQP